MPCGDPPPPPPPKPRDETALPITLKTPPRPPRHPDRPHNPAPTAVQFSIYHERRRTMARRTMRRRWRAMVDGRKRTRERNCVEPKILSRHKCVVTEQ
ncbi:hypothetical protein NL676_016506 [Syzygium grande]|nr:hypothetical protein NL676_016506 [Syzygium grande]